MDQYKVIYVGDSRDVIKRIRKNHCSGNVEASALRRAVAESLGFNLHRSKRKSGSVRIRLDMDNPRYGEETISSYLRYGRWKYIICSNYKEAHDLQWYVIENLKPILNKEIKDLDTKKIDTYKVLYNKMLNSIFFSSEDLSYNVSGPGVYILFHEFLPHEFNVN